MFFDELVRGFRQRLKAGQQQGRPDALLSDSMAVEASELWQAAQPADAVHITPADRERLAEAAHAAGWLLHREAGGFSAHFDGSTFGPSRTVR
jgi:hypothetical protein